MYHNLMNVSGTRKRNIFDPASKEPFKLSRSKIELFLECARCFYLDRRLGIGRPSGPPFTLNIAVDTLLKKEFDVHRKNGEPHPLMRSYGIDAVPFTHPDLPIWRENFQGMQSLHAETNFLVTGAPDDIWQGSDGKLIIVDYKATSTENKISMEDPWRQGYKRQMEIYQWLLRRLGFEVSDTGYFVYVNAGKDREAFDRRLEFTVELFPYTGSDAWVEDALREAHLCLLRDTPPPPNSACEWCAYRSAAKLSK